MTDTISSQVSVNGRVYTRSVEPRRLLSDFLRHDLRLTGTHVACAQGVCGACTIRFNGRTARSCLLFAAQADGAEIVTVEGLAGEGPMTPLQNAFKEEHALQCGFCTPGFLMAITEFLEANPDPDDEEIRHALGGNLCRCTGYLNIIRAVKSAAREMQAAAGEHAG